VYLFPGQFNSVYLNVVLKYRIVSDYISDIYPFEDDYGKLVGGTTCVKEYLLHEIHAENRSYDRNSLAVPTKTSMKRTGHKTFVAYSRYVDVNKDSLVQANKLWDNLTSPESKEPEMAYQKAT
jgi:hypothetical protein